jgi:hypothetical protein
MVESAILLGLTVCISFAVLLWKIPHKIRSWLLKRQLTLDAAFALLCGLFLLPLSMGVTSLLGLACAGLFWTAGLWIMKKLNEGELSPQLLLEQFT